ncbi:MAG: PEGA domain-containing protein [Deltaproteobacteria bacterium]|nr:PEGA domain-containing protein [Deltaproteobacteria bacterium]
MTIFLLFASAALPQQVETGILNIDSIPGGATVYVDGRIRGTTPVLLEVLANEHTIIIEQRGYETHKSNITVKKDKVVRTKIRLTRQKPKPNKKRAQTASITPNAIQIKENIRIHRPKNNSAPGTVFLDTTPQSLTASIDGYTISKTTPVAFDIRPGIYELKLFNDKNEIVYQKTIFVRSGKTLSLDIIIQKKRTIDYTDPWK